MTISHILITTDLSPESLRPLVPVGELARALGARVTLLYVTEQMPITGLPVAGEPLVWPIDLAERMEGVRALLERQTDIFGGIDVKVEVTAAMDTAHQIIEYANEHDVDLIAMATHGRTGFRRLVLGSVAERVLRHSGVPVVVFPRPDEAQSEARKSA